MDSPKKISTWKVKNSQESWKTIQGVRISDTPLKNPLESPSSRISFITDMTSSLLLPTEYICIEIEAHTVYLTGTSTNTSVQEYLE